MKISRAETLEQLREHKLSCEAAVILGSHDVGVHSPIEEFRVFRGALEADDADRLFFLNCGFAAFTRDSMGRVCDLARGQIPDEVMERVNSFSKTARPGNRRFDLGSSPELAPVLVCPDANAGPWTIVDGNHRVIAHYLAHGSVDQIPVYLCAHAHINTWRYVPEGAREVTARRESD